MPSTPWSRAFRKTDMAPTNAKEFADSVNARMVMPTKPLLDKTRECGDYFKTNVAETFAKARKAAGPQAAPPFQMSAAGADLLACIDRGLGLFGADRVKPTRPGLRRAK